MEARVVAREAVDAHALPQRCLAEDEVPRRVGIQVLHRDAQQRVRVSRQPTAKQGEEIRGEQLAVLRVRVAARGHAVRREIKHRHHFHRQREECGGECLQPVERRALRLNECAQRLQVELAAACIRPVRLRTPEGLEVLAFLRVVRKPVIGTGDRNRDEVRARLQSPPQGLGQLTRRSDCPQAFLRVRGNELMAPHSVGLGQGSWRA